MFLAGLKYFDEQGLPKQKQLMPMKAMPARIKDLPAQ